MKRERGRENEKFTVYEALVYCDFLSTGSQRNLVYKAQRSPLHFDKVTVGANIV